MQYHFTFKCTRINCSAKEVSYLEKRITCRYFIPYWTWTKTMCLLNKHTTSIDNIFNGKLLLDFSAFRIIVLSINNERKCGLALGYIGMGLEITLLLLCIRKAQLFKLFTFISIFIRNQETQKYLFSCYGVRQPTRNYFTRMRAYQKQIKIAWTVIGNILCSLSAYVAEEILPLGHHRFLPLYE